MSTLVLLFALPAAACPGESIPPPSAEFDTAGEPALILRDPTSAVRLGGLEIVLEETTMQAVVDTLGVGAIAHRGDAAESQYWICYTASAEGQRIWLTSGELNAGKYVDGITAVALSGPAAAPTEACPELPRTATPIRPVDGPWLGADAASVQARFGEPGRDGDRWSYGYLDEQGEFDTYAALVLRFTGDRVTFVQMGKATSN